MTVGMTRGELFLHIMLYTMVEVIRMDPILELYNMTYTYHTTAGETLAIDDVSFHVYPGEFIAIVGPSGCGKSTLLNIIAGILPATSGEILLNKAPIQTSEESISYMLQKDHLLEWRSIYRNITLMKC